MATAGITISAERMALRETLAPLKNLFAKDSMAAILKEAIEKAIQPAYQRLVELTPVGPTENLKRAANYKTKAYTKDGTAIGLIGYNRAGLRGGSAMQGGTVVFGDDRAFHQWWLEFGTRQREVRKLASQPYARRSKLGKVHNVSGQNAYIASSYRRLGPFKMVPTPNGEVQTDPPYQKAFFKKSKNPILIPAMTVGGHTGRPPVRTAWDQTQSTVASILQQELSITLERALDTLAYSATGSVNT